MLPSFITPDKIPHKPGIYIYKDEKGKVIYVGKAVDLYSRVSSYFSKSWHDVKTTKLVENIRNIETIIVESEIEALILEANLIKKFMPLYNIRLTDDKDYLYIVVTDEEYPKIVTARKKDLIKVKKWFGPYPSATTVKQTLKKLRRIFPWCQNPGGGAWGIARGNKPQSKTTSHEPRATSRRACFYFHIGQCPGACVGTVSKADYDKNIKRFSKFLDGKKQELLDDLFKEMDSLSRDRKFEEAAKIKKIVEGINYITSPNKITNYLVNPNFLEDLNNNSLEELQRDLNLPERPARIEAYDISNFQGKEATGSMVVLTNGEIDKSQYRRFKIKITGKPNDFAMHAEMMGRRLKHPEWPLPQLFLIDGGRGQVSSVKAVIDKHSSLVNSGNSSLRLPEEGRVGTAKSVTRQSQTLEGVHQADENHERTGIASESASRRTLRNDVGQIPIYGIAKREEWLYPPEGEPIKLPKKSLALRLLQKIRNESHRFAITYHKKLRAKAFLPKKA